jgi:tetratricopeptide (TPR) repeat protein
MIGPGIMLLLAAIAILSVGDRPAAQTASPAVGFAEQARNAIARGRLAEAEQLARSRPADDAAAVTLLARVHIIQGRYKEAEALLRPMATATPGSEAALELGLLLRTLGRRDEADRTLKGVLGSAVPSTRRTEGILRLATAARALSQFQEANNYFRALAAAAPDDPAVHTGWGDLFLEKYNRAEAMKSYQAALRANADWAPAHLGIAQALAEEDPPNARVAASRALELNPTLVGAHVFLAELDLDDGEKAAARERIAQAFKINPVSLEARSLLAALAYLEGRTADFEAEVARALAINPTYGEIYRVAGDHAARNYRFDEAVALVRKGQTLDSTSIRAYADLGVHLLRTGDEPGARQALERAFKADPYDVVTFNLLGMLDTLDKFQTIKEGDVVLRLHADELAVMREYAMPLAQDALRTLSARYGFTPKGPILIEVFPKHDDFAVRNVGLPGMIGALGACFGRVVTMDSPRARPPGSFHWGATLWHELAHVITLQMSNQRAPRWLSEGLSVFEEKRARSEWGREMEVAFVQAMIDNQILKLPDLNSGFSRPQTIALAYYQASLLVEHIIALHGEEGIHRMLRAYGEGLETDAAMRKAIGTDLAGLQDGFTRMLETKFASIRRSLEFPEAVMARVTERPESLRQAVQANPQIYPLQLALGKAQLAAGETDAAIRTLERATALLPMATGPDSARNLLIEALLSKRDRPRAMRELETLLGHDHTNLEAARQLSELAQEAGDEPRMWLAYERIVSVNPFEQGAHGSLGRLALKRGDADMAVREFRAALATDPVDRAGAHSDLAESYLLAGKPAEAKREALAALELAPSYERAQELLLQVVDLRDPRE